MSTTGVSRVSAPSTRVRRALLVAFAAGGALLAAAGCSGGFDIPPLPAGAEPLKGDQLCVADDEPGQGDPCSQDCLTATCASGTGKRVCTCEGGVFLQCACLPPDNWPYADVPAAPYCDPLTGRPPNLAGDVCKSEGASCRSTTVPDQGCTCKVGFWVCGASEGTAEGSPACESFGSGLGKRLDEKPCDSEWDLCISRDFNPTGTSPRGCVCQASGERLLWQCGPTNRWYRAQ